MIEGSKWHVAVVTVLAGANAVGCVHSDGISATGVTSFKGRTTVLGDFSVRTEVRLPRTYSSYAGTEFSGGTQMWTSASPSAGAGNGEPNLHLGVTYGWIRVPDSTESVGWRFGFNGGPWHGALGDRRSRWAVNAGIESALFVRLGSRLAPWQADETISILPVLIPAIAAAPLLRFGPLEDARFGMTYSATLSFGILFSSTVIP